MFITWLCVLVTCLLSLGSLSGQEYFFAFAGAIAFAGVMANYMIRILKK